MRVHRSRSVHRPKVTTDGEGLVSHAGVGLLSELADRSGLTRGLSVAMGECGISWHTHDPGVVLAHVAVGIANGADCLSDVIALREQDELFGPVASLSTAWRAIEATASVELRGIVSAVAAARERVWATNLSGLDSLTLDFDATLVTSYSEKQDAAPTYKRGFGFHPLAVWCDETREPLAWMLRPGNAGSNNTGDHCQLLDDAIDGLPETGRVGHFYGDDPGEVECPILVRADSAGATHGLVDALVGRNIEYSIGYEVNGKVRDALLLVQEEDWVRARELDGLRDGAEVTDLTGLVDMCAWGPGCRLICRRERPHPGAQLSLFDQSTGWRHTCFITNTPGAGAAILELRHRGHARVEDRIRCAKDCGLRNFPFDGFVRNEAWLATSMIAACLIAWCQLACLDDVLAKAEPKSLRYRLFHVAARLTRHGRQLVIHLDATWPWRNELATAYTRLRAVLP